MNGFERSKKVLAEMAMFFQILGMAVLAAIVPTIIALGMLYLIVKYRVQIWWFIKGIMRAISWLLIFITDGKTAADKPLH